MTGFTFAPASLRLVIFDLDGTLYHPGLLKIKMAIRLGLHFGLRPWRWSDLAILRAYRKAHEALAGQEIESAREAQLQKTLEMVRRPREIVEPLVDRWFFRAPLPYLQPYPDLAEWLSLLREKDIKTAVWSDYPTRAKLKALHIEVDTTRNAFDVDVNAFKPHPKGLQLILREMGFKKEEVLLIGDRPDRDGQAARQLGIPFVLIEPERAGQTYRELTRQLRAVNR